MRILGLPGRQPSTFQPMADLLARQAEAAPTLFIQQTDDPTGSFADLAAVLPQSAALRPVRDEDHAYADTRELVSLIGSWIPGPLPGIHDR